MSASVVTPALSHHTVEAMKPVLAKRPSTIVTLFTPSFPARSPLRTPSVWKLIFVSATVIHSLKARSTTPSGIDAATRVSTAYGIGNALAGHASETGAPFDC